MENKYTMRIGLVGVKGSGKTEIANHIKENFDNVNIIDDYIEDFAKECDIAPDSATDYIGNLYFALRRWSLERQISKQNPNIIVTCGTMIESATYATANAVLAATPYHYSRIENLMHLLGVFYQDTFNYDLVIYIPLKNPDPELSHGKVDELLTSCLTSFGVPFSLLDGTMGENKDKTLSLIQETKKKLDKIHPNEITPSNE